MEIPHSKKNLSLLMVLKDTCVEEKKAKPSFLREWHLLQTVCNRAQVTAGEIRYDLADVLVILLFLCHPASAAAELFPPFFIFLFQGLMQILISSSTHW
jgi:hypothetical protein